MMKRRKLFNRSFIAGSVILVVILLMAIMAPVLSPYNPNQTVAPSLDAPSAQHWLGTDYIGRDVLSRVIHGTRSSLAVAFPSVALALVVGGSLGLVAGYRGGMLDQILMRVLDVFFAFPVILLAITIVSVLGPSIWTLVVTIGIVYTPRFARVVRAPVLAVKEMEFVEAARSIGCGSWHIVMRHIVPNILGPVIVETSLSLSRAIFTETALSFLGLGPPPPTPTWGAMIGRSRQFLELAPWAVLGPGLAIMLAVMAFTLIGNGLRAYFSSR